MLYELSQQTEMRRRGADKTHWFVLMHLQMFSCLLVSVFIQRKTPDPQQAMSSSCAKALMFSEINKSCCSKHEWLWSSWWFDNAWRSCWRNLEHSRLRVQFWLQRVASDPKIRWTQHRLCLEWEQRASTLFKKLQTSWLKDDHLKERDLTWLNCISLKCLRTESTDVAAQKDCQDVLNLNAEIDVWWVFVKFGCVCRGW